LSDFGSPIERLFAEELFRQLASNPLPLTIQPQASVGPYFADFLLTLGDKRVAVECDGRDFHSTPAQVEHDRKRDEFFLRRGIETLRFTGSCIHRDVAGCVRQSLARLTKEETEYASDWPQDADVIRARLDALAQESVERRLRDLEADRRVSERNDAEFRERMARLRAAVRR
jgi:very-short-patch-repair endonuclease